MLYLVQPLAGPLPNRRPIRARRLPIIRAVAGFLARRGVSPNTVSLAVLVTSALGAGALLCFPPIGLLVCLGTIVVRMVGNLVDGLIAVEYHRGTRSGPILNEIPDRAADMLYLLALGHVAGLPWLGWFCAMGALATAYLRQFRASLGLGQDFGGLMAKPQRMFVLAVACACCPVETWIWHTRFSLIGATIAIAVGCVVTIGQRLHRIAIDLEAKP